MKIQFKKIYSKFLIIILFPIADHIMITKISYYYNQIRMLNKYSKKNLNNWQEEKLKNLINYAYQNTIYYRNLFDKNRLAPKDIQKITDLRKIPILTKKDIRNNWDSLISEKQKKNSYKISSTGGSTGEPLKYLLDKNSWSYATANTIINRENIGLKFGEKYLSLGSSSLFIDKRKSLKHYIYYKLKNKYNFSGINMSDDNCKKIIDLIIKKKIKYIYGYASSIFLLSKYINKKQLKVDINACLTTSEILLPKYKKAIENAFKCKILDEYGAFDGGITAFNNGEGFFRVGYNTVINIYKNNKNYGTAIITDLLNYSMPFINYQIGDVFSVNKKNSSYNGQIIKAILGRTSDIIYLENGNILTGPAFTVLFKDLPIEYYYIKKNGKNSIECYIKKLSTYNDQHEKIIEGTIKKQMGEKSKLSIKYSNKIFLSKNGKRKYFN